MAPKVFVIHGRDEEAHHELGVFIRSLGLEELIFETVADSRGSAPFIADVVDLGIHDADLIIALFTPDEQAALYSGDGHLLEHEAQSARWQSRPNVIFEAGWAYGRAREKTILVTLGPVTLFSDLSGVHFIKLDSPNGKTELLNRLAEFVQTKTPLPDNWKAPEISGNFEAPARKRWKFYDELHALENRLKHTTLGRTGISLQWIVLFLSPQLHLMPRPIGAYEFMRQVLKFFGDAITDTAYWELIISGFLEFNDVGYEAEGGWGIGKRWKTSARYARLASRGEMLLAKLALTGDATFRLDSSLQKQNSAVRALIKQQKYRAALSRNSSLLREHPDSARAHFNQARINARLGKARPAQAEDFLIAARKSLAEAIELQYIKLLVLTGSLKERQKPLEAIRNDVDLRPLFKRWPDLPSEVMNVDYVRNRGIQLAYHAPETEKRFNFETI